MRCRMALGVGVGTAFEQGADFRYEPAFVRRGGGDFYGGRAEGRAFWARPRASRSGGGTDAGDGIQHVAVGVVRQSGLPGGDMDGGELAAPKLGLGAAACWRRSAAGGGGMRGGHDCASSPSNSASMASTSLSRSAPAAAMTISSSTAATETPMAANILASRRLEGGAVEVFPDAHQVGLALGVQLADAGDAAGLVAFRCGRAACDSRP